MPKDIPKSKEKNKKKSNYNSIDIGDPETKKKVKTYPYNCGCGETYCSFGCDPYKEIKNLTLDDNKSISNQVLCSVCALFEDDCNC